MLLKYYHIQDISQTNLIKKKVLYSSHTFPHTNNDFRRKIASFK